VIATGGDVQGRIGTPQPLRTNNADSSGPSSNQLQAPAAPPALSNSSAATHGGFWLWYMDWATVLTF